MISHYLAVDGGASNTTIWLMSTEASEANQVTTAGPSSLTLPDERGITTLVDALAALRGQHRLVAAQCLLVAGIAGAGHPARKAVLEKALEAYPHKRITTDAQIASLGAGGGEPVNCIVVGTGTVATRIDTDGTVSVSGGWGFPIGDQGGGAWIGFSAVRALIRAVESGVFDLLGKRLASVIGSERTRILNWLASADASRYAQLAPIVLEPAAADCASALRIVRKGVVHIEHLTKACCGDNELPVVFLGGLGEYYQSRLSVQWQSRCIAPKGNALDGAMILARQIAAEAR